MECADAELALASLVYTPTHIASNRALHSHVCTCAACREYFAWLIVLRELEKIARDSWHTRARVRTNSAPKK